MSSSAPTTVMGRSSRLPGTEVFFFEEHREQYLHPCSGQEFLVRVLSDDEPAIVSPWETSLAASGLGGLSNLIAAPFRVISAPDKRWRVVVQKRSAGQVMPDFATAGKATVPDMEIACDSRAAADATALQLATRLMEDHGARVDPANAPLRLGIGIVVAASLISVGAVVGLFVAITVFALVASLLTPGLVGSPLVGIGAAVLFIGCPIGGAVSPMVVGRAMLRRRRRGAILRYGGAPPARRSSRM